MGQDPVGGGLQPDNTEHTLCSGPEIKFKKPCSIL